jgi:hypothetical protein
MHGVVVIVKALEIGKLRSQMRKQGDAKYTFFKRHI